MSVTVDQRHRNAYAGNYSWGKNRKKCKKSIVLIGKKREKQKMRKNNITLRQTGYGVKFLVRVDQRDIDAYAGK